MRAGWGGRPSTGEPFARRQDEAAAVCQAGVRGQASVWRLRAKGI